MAKQPMDLLGSDHKMNELVDKVVFDANVLHEPNRSLLTVGIVTCRSARGPSAVCSGPRSHVISVISTNKSSP